VSRKKGSSAALFITHTEESTILYYSVRLEGFRPHYHGEDQKVLGVGEGSLQRFCFQRASDVPELCG